MKVINKQTFKIEIVNNISVKKIAEWAVLDDNIELVDNTDSENPIELYPEKYRKELTLSGTFKHNDNLIYDVCTDIILMNQTEKDAVEYNLNANLKVAEYHNRRFKVEVLENYILTNYLALATKIGADNSVPKEYTDVRDGDGNLTDRIITCYIQEFDVNTGAGILADSNITVTDIISDEGITDFYDRI